jgi:hypothetical protein
MVVGLVDLGLQLGQPPPVGQLGGGVEGGPRSRSTTAGPSPRP